MLLRLEGCAIAFTWLSHFVGGVGANELMCDAIILNNLLKLG